MCCKAILNASLAYSHEYLRYLRKESWPLNYPQSLPYWTSPLQAPDAVNLNTDVSESMIALLLRMNKVWSLLPNSSIAISNEVIDPCTSFNLKSNAVIRPNTLHFKALKWRSAVAIMLDADAKLEKNLNSYRQITRSTILWRKIIQDMRH